jgi:hypothetical protein
VSDGIEQAYCSDTSALFELKNLYPIKTFPSIWRRVEDLIAEGRLIAPRAVLVEIERGDDELVVWARAHRQMFVADSQELIDKVSEILDRFEDLVDENKEYEDADPFVVALAIIEDGQPRVPLTRRCAVITVEHSRIGKSRIPHVCKHHGIEWIDWRQVFERESWEL